MTLGQWCTFLHRLEGGPSKPSPLAWYEVLKGEPVHPPSQHTSLPEDDIADLLKPFRISFGNHPQAGSRFLKLFLYFEPS